MSWQSAPSPSGGGAPEGRGGVGLSVLIVNWNTRDLLRACLRSLAEHPASGGQQVVVVDNGSADGSAQMVRAEFPWVALDAQPSNLGYAVGNNRAAQLATGRRLLLLNPDTEALPGSLDAALARLEADPTIGALGAKLLDPPPSWRPQSSLRAFPTPEAVLWELLGLSRLFPRSRRFGAYRMTWFDYDREIEVDQPMGSALFIPRAAWERVGPMDADFPIFFNEVDWCLRCRQAGYRIVFSPDVPIVHHGGGSTRQVRAAVTWESHRAMIRFYRKHYRRRLPRPLFQAIVGAIWLGALLRTRRLPPAPITFGEPVAA